MNHLRNSWLTEKAPFSRPCSTSPLLSLSLLTHSPTIRGDTEQARELERVEIKSEKKIFENFFITLEWWIENRQRKSQPLQVTSRRRGRFELIPRPRAIAAQLISCGRSRSSQWLAHRGWMLRDVVVFYLVLFEDFALKNKSLKMLIFFRHCLRLLCSPIFSNCPGGVISKITKILKLSSWKCRNSGKHFWKCGLHKRPG